MPPATSHPPVASPSTPPAGLSVPLPTPLPPATLRADGLRSAIAGPYALSVDSGECIAVGGPSGSGKTLLLRMLADLDPNQGEVELGGKPRAAFDAPAWRRQVMYVAAEAAWWSDLARDHFADPVLARGWLPRLLLDPDVLEAPVAHLSTGERQRLGLLRAILRQPRFLLLDEPTSALDDTSSLAVEALLETLLRQGLGIVLVSHSAAQARRLASRRYVLNRGGMAAAAP